MHTYEFKCFSCGSTANFEIYKKIDYILNCTCGSVFIMMFYLNSPDTRAKAKT